MSVFVGALGPGRASPSFVVLAGHLGLLFKSPWVRRGCSRAGLTFALALLTSALLDKAVWKRCAALLVFKSTLVTLGAKAPLKAVAEALYFALVIHSRASDL